MRIVQSILFLLILQTSLIAQEEAGPTPQAAEANASSILLLINEKKPTEVIVYSDKGVWLSEIREIQLSFDVGGDVIRAECTTWIGVLRPTDPKKVTYPVKEIKSVARDDFYDRLGKLNE